MFKKINTTKLFFLSFLGAIILSAPLMRLYAVLFDPGSSRLDYSIATFFGLMFSLPLSFGFYSIFSFSRYRERLMFMAAPTLFLNFLLLSLDGRPRDFVGMSLVGFVIGLMGIGVGFLVKFLYKKYRA